ncbi:transglycosylase SLT domain-containing protein [Cupriavidus sp. Marseille-Q8015]|nr:MAG: lytic transglycosylase domain-containing protein [Cupriavidus sp.]
MSGWKTLHLPGVGRALQVRLRRPVPGVNGPLQLRLAHPVASRALRGGRTTLKYALNSLGVLSVAAAVSLTVSQQWRTSLAGALAGKEAPAVLIGAAMPVSTAHANHGVPPVSADVAAARLSGATGLPTVSGVDEWSVAAAGKVPSVAHLAAQIPAQRVTLDARSSAALGTAREQATVADYIARKYRVASQATAQLVKAAYLTGREVGIDPLLILGVIAIESSFNPYAESGVGAQGLMQVMTKVHQDKYEAVGGVAEALNPYANIKIGALVLKDCIARAGSIEGGLRFYVGSTTSTDGGYGAKVLAERARLRALLGLPNDSRPAGSNKTQAERQAGGEKLEAAGGTAQAA